MTSPQIEREVGGRIKEAKGWTVDLDEPELEIRLELLTDQAFYFFGKHREAGNRDVPGVGLPALRRHRLAGGLAPDDEAGLHGHVRPLPQLPDPVAGVAGEGARAGDAADKVAAPVAAYLVPFGEIQQQVVLSVPGPMRVVVYRRLMRIAERIARQRLPGARHRRRRRPGGVADAGKPRSGGKRRHMALLDAHRMDETRSRRRRRLGTYPISIIPDQDCCTLFTPRNPMTRAKLRGGAAELNLPLEELAARASARRRSKTSNSP